MSSSADPQTGDVYLTHTGRLSQIGGITPFLYQAGKAKGTSTLRVRTAKGLEFWVVPDRGMDIYEASFRGDSLVWHSPTGMVHPSYATHHGLDWLNSFAGGLVSTCGLSTAGAPSQDAGEDLPLHGVISNTPAEQVNWSETWADGDCILSVSGSVRETSVHGHNLVLERTITTSLQSACVTISDSVQNQGVRESPLMLLYHINFGFPLLTSASEIHAPSRDPEPATEHAAKTRQEWQLFDPPQRGMAERVYFHSMQPDSHGSVTVVLVSDRNDPHFGVALTYDAASLPEFVEWKMTGTNHFVLGLEPANCRSTGRSAERSRGALQSLAPGERRDFKLKICVLDGAEQVQRAIASTRSRNSDDRCCAVDEQRLAKDDLLSLNLKASQPPRID